MKYDVKDIFDHFQIDGEFLETASYGSGHINDTFIVHCKQSDGNKRYIIQRIKHSIFKNPPELMDNVARVTQHIRGKLESSGVKDVDRRVLTVISARDGKYYYKDADGNYWRVYVFIENAKTYDVLENLDQAYKAAKAFGHFQGMLVDLPGPSLFETIPDFHNSPKRYAAFLRALDADVCNRAKDAKEEIEYLQANDWMFDVFYELMDQGRLPVRITHNDTKINNVMIDEQTNEGICVIDLDTVMPGLALYDFGDIVRTTASNSEEDETDLSQIKAEPERFEAFLRGYLAGAGDFLTQTEVDQLVFSGKLITIEQAARFLTDYLEGDTYYKIHREGHNLDRTRTQVKLVQSLTEQEEELNQLVSDCYKEIVKG